MMAKLENLGVKKSTVGLVVPTGYSFNLDGTAIYLTMAACSSLRRPIPAQPHPAAYPAGSVAAHLQGSGRHHRQRLYRAGRDPLGGGPCPVAGLALILGIDRFMSEARALTHLIGNGVATVVVGKWCNELDENQMRRHLDQETDLEAEEPEVSP